MEMLIPLFAMATFFGTVFGVSYLYITARNRERLALIEKGADASIFKIDEKTNKYGALKWGLVLVGLGLGIWSGSILGNTVSIVEEEAAIFSMLLLFGGIGLLAYYLITVRLEKKNKM